MASEGNALDGYTPSGSLNITFSLDPKLQSDDALTLQNGNIVMAGDSPAKNITPQSPFSPRYKPKGRIDSTRDARPVESSA